MKKLLTLAVVAFTAVQSFAIGLGIRDATVVGGLTGDFDDYSGYGSALTFEMLFPITDMISVHAGAGFDLVGLTYSTDYSGDYNLMYLDLSVPAMARFNITPGFFAEAGLNFGLNCGTWSWVDDDGETSDVESVDAANSLKVDLAIGAGYVFGFGLGLDGRFTYGLTDTFDYSNADSGRWGIHFGISYWFKKR